MFGDQVEEAGPPWRLWAAMAVITLTLMVSPSVHAAEPKVPAGKDPGGIAIALIGGGVDYTAATIATRLARDGEGELIGWDVIDDDRKPYAAPLASPGPAEAGATGNSNDATVTADALLAAYAKARLVPVRAPAGDPQALAKAIAFAAGTPARIVAIAVPVETDLMRTVVRQASERFKNHLFIIAGARPTLPGSDATPPESRARPSPPPSVMNLPNVLVVLAAADVEGRAAKDVVAAAEMVVMPRGGSMFGAMPGAPPRNAGEAVALAAASAACQSHGITELLGSAAKAAAIDASRPLEDNRAIRVLDPMCWYSGKRM